MPKKGETKQGVDWAAIKEEWQVGQMNLTQIASSYGVSAPAIRKRAAKEAWPDRPTLSEVVSHVVSKLDLPRNQDRGFETTNSKPEARPALMAFERAMQLLLSHRKDIAKVRHLLAQTLDSVDAIINDPSRKRPMVLGEHERVMSILSNAAQVLARLVPMERKAFGFHDTEGPSEFDGFTEEELQRVEQVIRKSLGQRGSGL